MKDLVDALGPVIHAEYLAPGTGLLALFVALIALLISLRTRRRLDERLARMAQRVDLVYDEVRSSRSYSTPSRSVPTIETEKKSPKDTLAEPPPEPTPAPEAPQVGLRAGLEKTRSELLTRLRGLFKDRSQIPQEFYTRLEELLITSDLGVKTTERLLKEAQAQTNGEDELSETRLIERLKESVRQILSDSKPAAIDVSQITSKPFIILVVGVNGVGKTTTIAKLAADFKAQGARVLVAACDTFRAAAVSQLETWGKRVGFEVISPRPNESQTNTVKPSTVAYLAVQKARNEQFDVLLLDTAGRLHTRVNLMNELEHVYQIIGREQPGSPQETILVLDASTGQNALEQARYFNERGKLTGLIVTKLDGTPKGGIVVAIKDELGIPIRYLGTGESPKDLRVFSADDFVEALFSEEAAA